MSNASAQEKRDKSITILLTPSELAQLKKETVAGGRTLKMSSLARQRIFRSSTEIVPDHYRMATLEANLQRAYQSLCRISLYLEEALSDTERLELLTFAKQVIGEIDQTVR